MSSTEKKKEEIDRILSLLYWEVVSIPNTQRKEIREHIENRMKDIPLGEVVSNEVQSEA